jgi:hypothetical protein
VLNHRRDVVRNKGRQSFRRRHRNRFTKLAGRQAGKQRIELGERKARRLGDYTGRGTVSKLACRNRQDLREHVGRHVHSGSRGSALNRGLLIGGDTNLELRRFR